MNQVGAEAMSCMMAPAIMLYVNWHGVSKALRSHTGGDELDFAVFRFTLGIPGFNDDNIPRVIGFLGEALLVVNHVVAGASVTPAQVGARCTAESFVPSALCVVLLFVRTRPEHLLSCSFFQRAAAVLCETIDATSSMMAQGRTEALGAFIAALAIATPSVQARLEEMQPGRTQSGGVGSAGAFMLAADLTEDQRKVCACRQELLHLALGQHPALGQTCWEACKKQLCTDLVFSSMV